MLSQFFAQRYLFSSESRSVVNLIAGLSVFAVAMPVAAMIILMSVFNGFEHLAESVCSAVDADLVIKPQRGKTFMQDEIAVDKLATIEPIEAWGFELEQSVLLEKDGHQATATLRGVDSQFSHVVPLAEKITAGRWQTELGDFDHMVIGQALAMQLGIRTLADPQLRVYAAKRNTFSSLLPMENYTRRRIEVSGIYQLDMDTEQTYVFTSLRFAQQLLHYAHRASSLGIKLQKGADAPSVKERVQQIVGEKFEVKTRRELNASFYEIMQNEKWGIFFISLLILVVASFSVIGALAMLIVDKREDIATIRALGADTHLVKRIFQMQGLMISGLGALIGTALGVGACVLQQTFGWIEIPADTFLTKSYPVDFQSLDLVLIWCSFAVVAFFMCRLTVRNMIKN